MRAVYLFLFLLTAPPEAGVDEASEAARAARAVGLARKAAESYTVAVKDGGAALTLDPEPLLQWSNPVAGSIHGSVFVWTSKGRPEVVASIYKFSNPLHHLGVEFHSLANAPLTVEREGRAVWSPERAGIEWRPVPGAPAPADAPNVRLRQLRALAKEFTASETTREDVFWELRLLTQPVYRHASTDPEVLDGALFAFVKGTDPEVFLLIEARRSPEKREFAWHYALARMNSVTLRAAHKGKAVWSVPVIPWARIRDPGAPYVLFVFQPGEGANPPGEPRDPFAR